MADERKHAARQQGDDNQVAHPGDAIADCAQEVAPTHAAAQQADGQVEAESAGEHQDDVEPRQGQDDDGEVGDQQQDIHRTGLGNGVGAKAHHQVEDGHGKGGGGCNPQVGLEFIGHRAAL